MNPVAEVGLAFAAILLAGSGVGALIVGFTVAALLNEIWINKG